MGFVAISTTVSGNDGFLKMSRIISTSLDPIGVDLGENGGIWSWAHTGTEWRPGEEFKDECTTVEEGVMACSDVSQAWWPWFPEILDFWKVSPTDPGERTAPGSCKTGTENEFPPVCGCTLLFYCFLYRRSQNDCTTEVPNEVSQVVWRPVRASGYDVILELWKSGYLMVYPTGAPSRQECNSKEEKVGFRKM